MNSSVISNELAIIDLQEEQLVKKETEVNSTHDETVERIREEKLIQEKIRKMREEKRREEEEEERIAQELAEKKRKEELYKKQTQLAAQKERAKKLCSGMELSFHHNFCDILIICLCQFFNQSQ